MAASRALIRGHGMGVTHDTPIGHILPDAPLLSDRGPTRRAFPRPCPIPWWICARSASRSS
jgi:hypothetical protein